MLRRTKPLPFFMKSDSYRVRVNAIDHDGCFGIQYMDSSLITEYHTAVIELLRKDRSHHIDYVVSSSNRQSRLIDCENAIHNQNNLALPVVRAFANALNAHHDPILLADITAMKKPGYTLSKLKEDARKSQIALFDKIPNDNQLSQLSALDRTGFCLSDDKVNIIYAIAHRTAIQHPNALITLNIFDDLTESVLNPLMGFYLANTSMLPHHIECNFYHYNTAQSDYSHSTDLSPTLLAVIKGTGKQDAEYYKTVSIMEKIAKSFEGKKSSYNMSNYLTPALLDCFLEIDKEPTIRFRQ